MVHLLVRRQRAGLFANRQEEAGWTWTRAATSNRWECSSTSCSRGRLRSRRGRSGTWHTRSCRACCSRLSLRRRRRARVSSARRGEQWRVCAVLSGGAPEATSGRYFVGDPVSAGPADMGYRLRKIVRSPARVTHPLRAREHPVCLGAIGSAEPDVESQTTCAPTCPGPT
jgi:hypothetical protein